MSSDPRQAPKPSSIAVVERGRSVTYGELNDLAARTASGLALAGVTTGDRVAVLATNELAAIVGILAARRVGGVACPLDAADPTPTVVDRMSALRPSASIVSPNAAWHVDAIVAEGVLGRAEIGTSAGSPLSGIGSFEGTQPLARRPSAGPDAAAILYTSGIVGDARCAVLTRQNLVAAQRRLRANGSTPSAGDVVLAAPSFAHILGFNMCLLPTLCAGATIVLPDSSDAEESLELIERHAVTQLVGMPAMWSAWLRAAERRDSAANPLASVEVARIEGSTPHRGIAEGVYEAFGFELAHGYGLTETAGTVSLEPNSRNRAGSVGRPLPGVEIKLVEDGDEVERGDLGEIWVRTGSIFEGYFGDASATAEVLISNGWCRTGDIAVQADDDALYLVGRTENLINVSGFNFYPNEVEAVLETHSSIERAVVVGRSDDVSGAQVVAFVAPVSVDRFDRDAVIDYCRSRLSPYKVPASILPVNALPLTGSGKRNRNDLR